MSLTVVIDFIKVSDVYAEFSDKRVNQIFKKDDGQIWVGTENNGLFIIKDNSLKKMPAIGNDHIVSVLASSNEIFAASYDCYFGKIEIDQVHSNYLLLTSIGKIESSNYFSDLIIHDKSDYSCWFLNPENYQASKISKSIGITDLRNFEKNIYSIRQMEVELLLDSGFTKIFQFEKTNGNPIKLYNLINDALLVDSNVMLIGSDSVFLFR